MDSRTWFAAPILALAAACGADTPSGPDAGGAQADATIAADAARAADGAPAADAEVSADAAIACVNDSDCGDHATCEGEGTDSECVCVAAYADDGDGCSFAGALEAPDFEDPDVWTATGDAVVNPGASSSGEGFAVFNSSAICALDSISQVVEMPSIDDAEPFVVRARHSGNGPDFDPPPDGALEVAGGWMHVPSSETFAESTRCLGARGYGGDVSFGVSSRYAGFDCSESRVTFDRLAIEPAEPGQCPAPGEVPNGDFEGDEGWTLETSGDGTAAIAAGAGAGGTAGLELSTETLCSSAAARGKVSVPLTEAVPNPAISFFREASNGTQVEVSLDGIPLTIPTGTGDAQLDTVCLPAWSEGLVGELQFALPRSFGICDDPDLRSARIDNVQLVDAPACGDGPLTDPGFESITSSIQPGWAFDTEGASQVQILDNDSIARTGSGALQLIVSQQCEAATAETSFTVPAPAEGEGPAVTLYHTEGHDEPDVKVTVGESSLTLPKDAVAYDPATLCLPPELAGRPTTLSITMEALGTCSETFRPRVVHIDDVEVTTDPSCPTE